MLRQQARSRSSDTTSKVADETGDPLASFAMEDAGSLVVHIAVNAYEEGGTNITPVQEWVTKGDLLYLDQKLSPAISGRSGLQLPSEVRSLRGYEHKLMTEADLVKNQDQKATRTRCG